MFYTFRATLAVMLVNLICVNSRADERVLLKFQAKKGLVTKYKVSMIFGASPNTSAVGKIAKQEVTFVSGQGHITSRTETIEATINDKKLSAVDVKVNFPAEIQEEASNGAVIGQKAKPNLIAAATQIYFPEKPVGVGDTWEHKYNASDIQEGIAAVLTFKLVGFKNLCGRETVNIETSFGAQDNKTYPNTITGTLWVEKSTGDIIEANYHGNELKVDAYRVSGNALDDALFIDSLEKLHTIRAVKTLDGRYIGALDIDAQKTRGTSFAFYKNGRFVKYTWQGLMIAGRNYFSEISLLGSYHFDGETLELVYKHKTVEKIKLKATSKEEPLRPAKITIAGKPYERDDGEDVSKTHDLFGDSGYTDYSTSDWSIFNNLYWR